MKADFLKIINRKFFIAIITSSTFVTGCTFSVIWFYLANIDRLDILYDALSVTSAIGIIFGFTLLSLFGFSIVIFISSFLLYLIYLSNEQSLKHYEGLPSRLANVSLVNSIMIFIVFISLLFSQLEWTCRYSNGDRFASVDNLEYVEMADFHPCVC